MSIPEIIQRIPARTRAETVRNLVSGLWSHMVTGYQNGMDQIWSPSDCTTADVLSELGTDAVKIFQLSAEIREFINSVSPGTIAPPALPELIYHADGSVELAALTPE